MEGVVRAPSEFSITLGLPPSMIATQEFVVPRSMPMIFAMSVPFPMPINPMRDMGMDDAVVQQVSLLQHVDHGIGLAVRGQHADRLVLVRVELLPDRVDLLQARL